MDAFSDFDNHLDDVRMDWRNEHLFRSDVVEKTK